MIPTFHEFRDGGHAVGPVVATAAENAHPVAVAPADKSEAVVLDFIGPLQPGRHRIVLGVKLGCGSDHGPPPSAGAEPPCSEPALFDQLDSRSKHAF